MLLNASDKFVEMADRACQNSVACRVNESALLVTCLFTVVSTCRLRYKIVDLRHEHYSCIRKPDRYFFYSSTLIISLTYWCKLFLAIAFH